MSKSEVSGVVFLDLKKAFDLVDHDILLKKLAIYLKNSSSLKTLNHIFITERNASYSMALTLQRISKVWCTTRFCFWDLVFLVFFINDLPLHVKDISVDCDMLADDTTLHTSGKDIIQIRSNIQNSLDQVSN